MWPPCTLAMENIDLLNRQFFEHLASAASSSGAGHHLHASPAAASLAPCYATASSVNCSSGPIVYQPNQFASAYPAEHFTAQHTQQGHFEAAAPSANASMFAPSPSMSSASDDGYSFTTSNVTGSMKRGHSVESIDGDWDQENQGQRRRSRRRGSPQQAVQRQAANLRERRRMQSINDAFEVRSSCLPVTVTTIPCRAGSSGAHSDTAVRKETVQGGYAAARDRLHFVSDRNGREGPRRGRQRR